MKLTSILPPISTPLQLDQLVRHSIGCKGSRRSSARHPKVRKQLNSPRRTGNQGSKRDRSDRASNNTTDICTEVAHLNADCALLHLAYTRRSGSVKYREAQQSFVRSNVIQELQSNWLHQSKDGSRQSKREEGFIRTYRAAAAHADDEILQATHVETVVPATRPDNSISAYKRVTQMTWETCSSRPLCSMLRCNTHASTLTPMAAPKTLWHIQLNILSCVQGGMA